MYYNSNQNSNEYYSSYKKEMSAGNEYEPTDSLPLLIKVGMGVLFLGVIGVTSIYLVNYFSTEKKETVGTIVQNEENNTKVEALTREIPKITLSEEELPKSIQLQASESKMISQLKSNATDSLGEESPSKSKEHNAITKEVIALTETSNMSSQDISNIVEIIMNKKRDEGKSSLEEELLNAEKETTATQTLEEINHYNKVVLSSKKENNDTQPTKVNNNLDTLIDDAALKNKASTYEKSLKSEVLVRSNEMRIIIVKSGDTLSKIAKKAYGDTQSYDKIFKANPEIIKNPDQIFVGQKLRIPS